MTSEGWGDKVTVVLHYVPEYEGFEGGLEAVTLAKTPVGLATRIAAKVAACTYGLYVNRLFGRPWGRIKELWA